MSTDEAHRVLALVQRVWPGAGWRFERWGDGMMLVQDIEGTRARMIAIDHPRALPMIHAALRQIENCARCEHPAADHRTPGQECVHLLGPDHFCSCGMFQPSERV